MTVVFEIFKDLFSFTLFDSYSKNKVLRKMNVLYTVPGSELFCDFLFFLLFLLLPMQVSPGKMYCFIQIDDGELKHHYFNDLTQAFQFCDGCNKKCTWIIAFTVKLTL